MRLKRILIASAIAMAMVSQAHAGQWSVGAGVSNFDIEDVSMNTVDARVGYKVQAEGSAFSYMPELRLGVGAGDDAVNVYVPELDIDVDVNTEIDSMVSVGVRLGYDATDSVGLFLEPTVTKLKTTYSVYGESASETSDWEYGTGLGVAFNFGDKHGVELSYDRYSDANVLSAAYRFRF